MISVARENPRRRPRVTRRSQVSFAVRELRCVPLGRHHSGLAHGRMRPTSQVRGQPGPQRPGRVPGGQDGCARDCCQGLWPLESGEHPDASTATCRQDAAGPKLASPRSMAVQPLIESNFTQCMEQLQEGYVFSVAATAGCAVELTHRDQNGIDVIFTRPSGATLEEAILQAQLKCTTTLLPDPSKPTFSFQFNHRSHFDHLAKARSTVKAILLVMVTEPDQSMWTSAGHDSLSVRKCCYWSYLEGQVSDADKPSVRIPTQQVFSATALSNLMDRVQQGQPL